MEKKGQQMTLSTIIIIALGIAVFVFLIFGFTQGWGNLYDRIFNLGGGGANTKTIAQACDNECAIGGKDQFAYKSQERTLKDGTTEYTITCDSWAEGNYYNETTKKYDAKLPSALTNDFRGC
jgi:hypothetical protein